MEGVAGEGYGTSEGDGGRSCRGRGRWRELQVKEMKDLPLTGAVE